MPLFAQVGIVEADGRAGLRRSSGFGQRDDLAVVDVHQLLVEFHLAHFSDPGHVEGSLVEIGAVIELHDVPAVQAGGARAFLVPFVYREQALQRLYPDVAEHGVEIGDARTGGDAARTRYLHDRRFDARYGLFAEADQQFALDGVLRREYEFGGGFRFRLGTRRLFRRILGARTQGECRRQEQQAP